MLLGHDGRIWAIDNGLSFHAEFKLRTVIWEFGGDRIARDVAEPVERSSTDASPTTSPLLDPFERDALRQRARALVTGRRFPSTGPAAATPGPWSERTHRRQLMADVAIGCRRFGGSEVGLSGLSGGRLAWRRVRRR